MKKTIIFPFLIVLCFKCYSQEKDSLKIALKLFEQGNYKKFLADEWINYYKNNLDSSDFKTVFDSISSIPSIKSLPDSIIALSYHKIGVLEYARNANDINAIKNYKKALKIRNKIFPEKHPDIYNTYFNIGDAYLQLKYIDSATVYLKKSIELNEISYSHRPLKLSQAYKGLAQIYLILDDFEYAESFLNLSYNNCPREGKKGLKLLNQIQTDFFDYYRKIGNYSKMISWARKALGTANLLGDEILADCYNNLGIANEIDKNLEKAKSNYLESIEINKQNEYRKEFLAENYINYSLVLLDLGDFKEAIETIEKGIQISNYNNFSDLLSYGYNNKAEIIFESGKNNLDSIERALFYHYKSLEYFFPHYEVNYNSIQNLPIDSVGEKNELVRSLSDLGKVLVQKFKLEAKNPRNQKETLSVLKTLYNDLIINGLIKVLRQRYSTDKSKQKFNEHSIPIFENALYVNYKLPKTGERLTSIYEIMEKSKYILLLEDFNWLTISKRTGLPQNLIDEQINLESRLMGIENENNSHREKTEILIKLNNLKQKINEINPKFYSLFYEQNLTSIPKIKKELLRKDQALIEYFVGENGIFVLGISKNKQEVIYLSENELGLKSIKSIIKNFRNEEKYPEFDRQLAFDLYSKLIPSIIREDLNLKKLIIIPDGILGYFPFEALITKSSVKPDKPDVRDFLVNKFAVSYGYSASMLNSMKKKKINPSKNSILAVAPKFNRIVKINNRTFPPLYLTNGHINSIWEIFDLDTLTNNKATVDNFFSSANNHRFLHFYTHGFANDNSGNNSFLVLQDSSEEPTALYTKDLYSLNLNADMVVLTACETARGELKRGEGIISMSRGFTYAGAKSIISTLWKIKEENAGQILPSFYRNLKEGDAKDKAMQKAKIEFLAKNPEKINPHYWAPIIATGDMSPVVGSNITYWRIAVIGALILFVWFFLWKRKSDKNI